MFRRRNRSINKINLTKRGELELLKIRDMKATNNGSSNE